MPVETVNVPLVLSYDTRGVDADAASFTDGLDQRRENCDYEITRGANGAEPTASLVRRQGATADAGVFGAASGTQYLVMADPASAWTTYKPWIAYKSSNDTQVRTSDTTITVLSDANYVPRFWQTTRLSGTDYCVLQLQKTDDPAASTHSQKVFYSSAVGTWTQIADSASVFSAFKHRGMMEFLDGYGMIASGKRIHNSALNDLQSWGANDYITISSTQDELQGLMKLKRRIIGAGRETMEAFEIPSPGNATGSILNRITDTTVRIGLADVAGPASISGRTHYYTVINDLLFTLGRYGGVQADQSLVVYDGQRWNKISREFEDKLLSSSTVYSVNRISCKGKVGVAMQMTAPTATAQAGLVYFPDLNEFFYYSGIWSFVNNGYHYASANDPQKLYYFGTANKYIDHSTTFTMTVQFKVPTRDTEYKELLHLGLIGDTMRSAENIAVQYSKDDGQNWSAARNLDMSKMHKVLNNGPVFRELWVRLVHAGTNEVRLKRAEMKIL